LRQDGGLRKGWELERKRSKNNLSAKHFGGGGEDRNLMSQTTREKKKY